VTDWIWVRADTALDTHETQLAEHGGLSGIRDRGAFESAMARPENLAAYGEPDAAALAASYAYGLVTTPSRTATSVLRGPLRAAFSN